MSFEESGRDFFVFFFHMQMWTRAPLTGHRSGLNTNNFGAVSVQGQRETERARACTPPALSCVGNCVWSVFEIKKLAGLVHLTDSGVGPSGLHLLSAGRNGPWHSYKKCPGTATKSYARSIDRSRAQQLRIPRSIIQFEHHAIIRPEKAVPIPCVVVAVVAELESC